MFVVNMVAGKVKYDLMGFNREEDAVGFAEMHNWELKDGNGFVWDLEIDEIEGDADGYYMTPEEKKDE